MVPEGSGSWRIGWSEGTDIRLSPGTHIYLAIWLGCDPRLFW